MNITKRKTKINNIELNTRKKFIETQMQLRSVFLQINGLEKQIKLY